MEERLYTTEEVREALIEATSGLRNPIAWAATHFFHVQAIYRGRNSTRGITQGIANALGFEKVTMWRKKSA